MSIRKEPDIEAFRPQTPDALAEAFEKDGKLLPMVRETAALYAEARRMNDAERAELKKALEDGSPPTLGDRPGWGMNGGRFAERRREIDARFDECLRYVGEKHGKAVLEAWSGYAVDWGYSAYRAKPNGSGAHNAGARRKENAG